MRIKQLLIALTLPTLFILSGCETQKPITDANAESAVAVTPATTAAVAPVSAAPETGSAATVPDAERCANHPVEANHDCVKHCANHKGKKDKTCKAHCDHKAIAEHDCAKHCAEHKGKKDKICRQHCAGEAKNGERCAHHHADADQKCGTEHCAHHQGSSAHRCDSRHCEKHGGNMADCCTSDHKCETEDGKSNQSNPVK